MHLVDIRKPRAPRNAGFIGVGSNSYVGEGISTLRLDTPSFQGDVLTVSLEPCDRGEAFNGGMSAYDVTDPKNPKPLFEGFGDFDQHPELGANASHSLFSWDAGRRAFSIITDNEERENVDIIEITDPRNPKLIAEFGLDDWPEAKRPLAFGSTAYHHDLWVKKIEGRWTALLSYWDAGYIALDVTDPENPRYLGDTDWPRRDPITGVSPAEGNAHQGTWDSDDELILGADEDFGAFRTSLRIDGAEAVAGEFGWARPVAEVRGRRLSGRVVFGGRGCEPTIPSPPAGGSGDKIVVVERGDCFFSTKVRLAQEAGYDAVIIPNSHEGAAEGDQPNATVCGSAAESFDVTISAICTTHAALHEMFGIEISYGERLEPTVGKRGVEVEIASVFDGYGYLNLYDADTLEWLDAYAIAQADDARRARRGGGHLSMHEIKTDPRPDVDLGYLSYYAGGFRVVSFDEIDGIVERGHFIARGGNDFWGVFPIPRGPRNPLILLSDRDSGLWILRYTGNAG
ncbi:MAG: hypothetical protein M3N53_00225 [Actinomycetota bacterium]|nr:hypothetical protein [Actinomycetota bacterium]